MKPFVLVTLCLLTLGAACSDDRPVQSTSPSGSSGPTRSTSPAVAGRQPFDRLTIELHLETREVRPGGTIRSQVRVENRSERSVTDPGCLLHAYRFGLIPADEPNAELWGQVVVDCSGKFVVRPGYIDSYLGPSFRATDKYGDPLPVGEYLAVMELEKMSERIAVPVTIAE